MIAYARLHLQTEIHHIAAEVKALLNQPGWHKHYNQQHHEGSWQVLALRSPSGDASAVYADARQNEDFADTPLLDALPAIKALLTTFQCPLLAVRLLNLAAGAHVKTHRDPELAFEKGEARLHIPVLTNPQVKFTVKEHTLSMKTGSCWYINANLPHSVANSGTTDRIHLVIDCQANHWLQELFEKAPEKKEQSEHDPETLKALIMALRNQGTDAAAMLAAQFELQLVQAEVSPLKGWIPGRIRSAADTCHCEWRYTGHLSYLDPFFDETLSKCLSHKFNSASFRSRSDLSVFAEWNDRQTTPAAIIFHVSRCGSTLLAQLLGLQPENLVLAEVPFFDDLLRLMSDKPLPEVPDQGEIFRAALGFYKQGSNAAAERVFLKTDSWHIHFAPLLRKFFPEVPFILLYRQPDEVLRSHRKLAGMQAVPGVIPDHFLGIESDEHTRSNPDLHLATVLKSYFDAFIELAKSDDNSILINYNEGASSIMATCAACTDLEIDDAYQAEIETRSRFNAKKPEQVFEELHPEEAIPIFLQPAFKAYRQLEQMRLIQVVRV